MRNLRLIAGLEFQDALRNRWVAAAVCLLGGLALVLCLVGAAPGGESRASGLELAVANLSSLSVYLVPLLALMLSFDALVGEAEKGTLGLLLTYPVSRWEVVAGKFLGHVLVLFCAIVAGYGGTGVLLILIGDSTQGWLPYTAMMASSFLLGAVFVALGCLISAMVRERATAVGAAIVTWLCLVVLYDLGILGVLVIENQQLIGERAFAVLMLVNPTDAYRLLNLLNIDSTQSLAGIITSGTSFVAGIWPVLVSFALWIVVPLAVTAALFSRREL